MNAKTLIFCLEVTDEDRQARRIDKENTRTFVTNDVREALELFFIRLRHSVVLDLMSFNIESRIGVFEPWIPSVEDAEHNPFDVHVHGTMLVSEVLAQVKIVLGITEKANVHVFC